MAKKLLSVVMPTYNRATTIRYNIGLLRDQILRNAPAVELVVCNDASTDNTSELIGEMLREEPWFRYVDYSEHAPIGVNLARCIDEAEGEYFVFMGDDDIPAPFMVDCLLRLIHDYPDVACYHFNRMKADDVDGVALSNSRVFYRDYEQAVTLYDRTEDFVMNHFGGMCFLSVYMVSTDAWRRGKTVYSDTHLGFEYLAPILCGVKDRKCLYFAYPLCIQRCLSRPAYDRVWPAYLYLGIPRILICLQREGVIGDWKTVYDAYRRKAQANGQFNDSLLGYLNNMLYRASLDPAFYRTNIAEINRYQSSSLRRACTYLVFLPAWVGRINRTIIRGIMRMARIG